MLTLTTGLPGSGKTLHTLSAVKARAEKEGRQVYVNGIPDLTLGWHELEKAEDWHTLPPGSIIVIDECQRVFPVRKAGQNVPEHVSQFETHRHKGFDIYLITQMPRLIDSHVRALVGQHYHVVRKFGFQTSYIYEWNKCNEDLRTSEFKTAQKHNFNYPREAYAWYKSAEIHTHKGKLPKRILLIPLAMLVLIGCAAYLYYYSTTFKQRMTDNAMHSGGVQTASVPAALLGSPAPVADRHVMTRKEYIAQYVPRLAEMPESAPAYDAVAVVRTFPRVAVCMASARRCECFTQQGTILPNYPDVACRDFAEHGAFNAYQDDQPQQASSPPPPPVQPVVTVATQ